MTMRALTVRQPYSWLIVSGYKPVENRGWKPPCVGERIAIHAGKKPFEEALAKDLARYGYTVPESIPYGAVEGVATVTGWVRGTFRGPTLGTVHSGRAVAFDWHGMSKEEAKQIVRNDFYVPKSCGWVLANVVKLPTPIPCKGRQGVWPLPPHVERDVLAQLDEVPPLAPSTSHVMSTWECSCGQRNHKKRMHCSACGKRNPLPAGGRTF